MLAEVRAGTRWWNHLRSLNHEEVQLRMLEENTEKWQVSCRIRGRAERMEYISIRLVTVE